MKGWATFRVVSHTYLGSDQDTWKRDVIEFVPVIWYTQWNVGVIILVFHCPWLRLDRCEAIANWMTIGVEVWKIGRTLCCNISREVRGELYSPDECKIPILTTRYAWCESAVNVMWISARPYRGREHSSFHVHFNLQFNCDIDITRLTVREPCNTKNKS